jgi:hypothetical protein
MIQKHSQIRVVYFNTVIIIITEGVPQLYDSKQRELLCITVAMTSTTTAN